MVKRILATVIVAAFSALLIFFMLPKLTHQPSLTAEALASEISFDHDDNLQAETDALLPLFDKMPPVSIYIKDEPILKTGTNIETGAAYTQCFNQQFPNIFVKKIFYQKANRKQLINALKHELTHAWLCRHRIAAGHDARFRQKFEEVGGFGN